MNYKERYNKITSFLDSNPWCSIMRTYGNDINSQYMVFTYFSEGYHLDKERYLPDVVETNAKGKTIEDAIDAYIIKYNK